MDPSPYFGVERGRRATSLDSKLYEIAIQNGVKFVFGTRVEKIDDLPPKSIIATGLDPKMYNILNLPYRDTPAMHTHKPSNERDAYACSIYSRYATEYFYAAEFHNLLYCMLPIKNSSEISNLKTFLPQLKRLEHIDIPA